MGASCPPLVFLDGVGVGTTANFDFDGSVSIDQLEAIEMYNGSANIPIGFHLSGADCGVIAMWTRDAGPSSGRVSASHLDLRWQPGGQVTDGDVQYGRIGVQAAVGVADVVEGYVMLNTVLSRPTGVIRPFVEVQLLSPFCASRAQVHFFTGLRLRLH